MHRGPDPYPRVFQANTDRLYRRVVLACLDLMPTHVDALIEGAGVDAALLAQVAKQVDNHTAEEARRAFALVLAATFERQVRLWCRTALDRAGTVGIDRREIGRLLEEVSEARGLQTATEVRAAIGELLLLANVVRHGDGRSSDTLREKAPHLWLHGTETFDQAMPASPLASDGIRVTQHDLRRYASALFQFWGTADTLPLAVVDAPY